MSKSMQFLLVGDLQPEALERGRHPEIKRLLAEEQAHARKGYMEGSIRQIWLQSPGPGAIAILEADSLEDAEKVALSFPLAQAGLLKVKVIALTPYAGFGGA
jgi:muconolactone delta-isomerase